jgi:hypothetical protein
VDLELREVGDPVRARLGAGRAGRCRGLGARLFFPGWPAGRQHCGVGERSSPMCPPRPSCSPPVSGLSCSPPVSGLSCSPPVSGLSCSGPVVGMPAPFQGRSPGHEAEGKSLLVAVEGDVAAQAMHHPQTPAPAAVDVGSRPAWGSPRRGTSAPGGAPGSRRRPADTPPRPADTPPRPAGHAGDQRDQVGQRTARAPVDARLGVRQSTAPAGPTRLGTVRLEDVTCGAHVGEPPRFRAASIPDRAECRGRWPGRIDGG